MEDSAFSDEFCAFIQAAIPTVEAAELLLLLQRDPLASYTLAEAIAKLHPSSMIDAAEGARYQELFRAASLVAMTPIGAIQYRPATGTLAAHVQTLAQAYQERPVTLIRMIYALRDTKIRSFAEAFRIRRR